MWPERCSIGGRSKANSEIPLLTEPPYSSHETGGCRGLLVLGARWFARVVHGHHIRFGFCCFVSWEGFSVGDCTCVRMVSSDPFVSANVPDG